MKNINIAGSHHSLVSSYRGWWYKALMVFSLNEPWGNQSSCQCLRHDYHVTSLQWTRKIKLSARFHIEIRMATIDIKLSHIVFRMKQFLIVNTPRWYLENYYSSNTIHCGILFIYMLHMKKCQYKIQFLLVVFFQTKLLCRLIRSKNDVTPIMVMFNLSDAETRIFRDR